jgi:hypothetical protein
MDRARATEGLTTPEFRTRHPQHIPEHPQQRRVAVDINRMISSVDLERKGHVALPILDSCEEAGWQALKRWHRALSFAYASAAALPHKLAQPQRE